VKLNSRLRVLSYRARRAVEDFAVAEIHHIELALLATHDSDSAEVADRRASKARHRAIATGDRLADLLSELAEAGGYHHSSDLIVSARLRISSARRRLAGSDRVPTAHPLADTNKPYTLWRRSQERNQQASA
jgi:hypothetical protein